ncbi:hypothetical protein [Methylocapsa sp. S129]|uniref:hypothetical protein n=1 Tax=Methylocapsa sp. S129 TaxID=1641869 RepID=UPI00131B9BFF|nr:hypothetical protein [Methylocapsa sp. S129]
MRTMLMLATAAAALAFGAVSDTANAVNSNVPSWSPYAIMGDSAAPRATAPRPMIERRAADENVSPMGAANGYVDYKSVGLSGNPEDCNKGCAVSNGG